MANNPSIAFPLLKNGIIDKSYYPTHSLLFTHEVIGHGFGYQALEDFGRPYERAYANKLGAVQTNNMYFRAIGNNYVDIGSGHIILPGSNYNGIPFWYGPKFMNKPQ